MRSFVRLMALTATSAAMVAACSSKKDESRAAQPPAPTKAAIDAAAPTADGAPVPVPVPVPVPADAAAPTITTGAATRPSPTSAAPDAPTNLQALPRTWPRDRVETYMKQRVARGLGVDCKHCHDPRAFAADSDRKRTARTMIRMTNEINREFFGSKQRVSCMTCHDGRKKPASGD